MDVDQNSAHAAKNKTHTSSVSMSQTSSATTHPRGNTASHSISSPTTSETIDVIQGSDVDVDFDTMYESYDV